MRTTTPAITGPTMAPTFVFFPASTAAAAVGDPEDADGAVSEALLGEPLALRTISLSC